LSDDTGRGTRTARRRLRNSIAGCVAPTITVGSSMSVTNLLEVGKIVGSVFVAWFALVGWRLLPAIRASR
jgi:hypothetical protein